MTQYRILHQETDDPERWRLDEKIIEASSSQSAVRQFVKGREKAEIGTFEEGSTTFVAVPARSWVERNAEVRTQLRLVVS